MLGIVMMALGRYPMAEYLDLDGWDNRGCFDQLSLT